MRCTLRTSDQLCHILARFARATTVGNDNGLNIILEAKVLRKTYGFVITLTLTCER